MSNYNDLPAKTVMCDKDIIEEIMKAERENRKPMISPFICGQKRKGSTGQREISSGLSSFGYDVTLDRDIRIFKNKKNVIIDPKRFSSQHHLTKGKLFKSADGSEYCVIPPNSYLLGHTAEQFAIPRDITTIVVGKSTYARCGLIINVTPIEAGFEGTVVIEIANCTTSPVRVYVNEGIAQFTFFRGSPCEVSYSDRDGKYQNQSGIQIAKV